MAVVILMVPMVVFSQDQPSADICDKSTDATKPHLPWCEDRPGVPCHQSVESCEKLSDIISNTCRTGYKNCYERFVKVSDKVACAESLQGFRNQLDMLACNWPHMPEPKFGICGGKDYILYGDEVRVGGKPTWRNNNPGALTCLKDREEYGAYDACKSFAVFPDLPTGAHALLKWLMANKGRSILQFAETHAPPDNGAPLNKGNKPGEYADKIIAELRMDNPGKHYDRSTQLGSLSEDELGTVVRAVTTQEGSTDPANQGKKYNLTEPDSIPADIKKCLGI